MNRLTKYFTLALIITLLGCDEASLLNGDEDRNLFVPSSIQKMPNLDYFLVANANLRLEDVHSSLVLLDPQSKSVLPSTKTQTLNFGTYPLIDQDRSRILVPDFDQHILAYTFKETGNAEQPFLIEPENIRNSAEGIINALEVDDQPSQIQLVPTAKHGDIYVVVHQLGHLTVIKADDMTIIDLNEEDRYTGFELDSFLVGESGFRLGRFGSRGLSYDENTHLLFVTNPASNLVYIFDPEQLENEAVISMKSFVDSSQGLVSMVFDQSGHAILAHQGLQSLVVINMDNISDNGIAKEVIEPSLHAIIPLQGSPDGLVLNQTGDQLYVSLPDTNEILEVDLALKQVSNRLTLQNGIGPSGMALHDNGTQLWVLNGLSNTITSIDLQSFTEEGDLQ